MAQAKTCVQAWIGFVSVNKLPHTYSARMPSSRHRLYYIGGNCFGMGLSTHICSNMSIGSARLGALGSGARSCLAGALARGALAVADPRALSSGPAWQAARGLTLPCTRIRSTTISFSTEIPLEKLDSLNNICVAHYYMCRRPSAPAYAQRVSSFRFLTSETLPLRTSAHRSALA